MTTTAHEDQFTMATQTIEPVRQPYDTVAILKRNVADLEVALKQQTERAEKTEAELAKLREQKPVAWRHENGNIFLPWQKDLIVTGAVFSPLYAAPVPAPAMSVVDAEEWARRGFWRGYELGHAWAQKGDIRAAWNEMRLSVACSEEWNKPQAPAVPELDPMTRLIVSDPKQIKPKK